MQAAAAISIMWCSPSGGSNSIRVVPASEYPTPICTVVSLTLFVVTTQS